MPGIIYFSISADICTFVASRLTGMSGCAQSVSGNTMDIKSKTFILLICLCNFLSGQETSNSTYLGFQKLLAGDYEASVKFYSQAIQQDSTAFENYYLRAYTRAWSSDTSNCISDFFKAIDMKRKFPRIPTDTTINKLISTKPSRASRICSRSLDHESEEFFKVWLGTWLMLMDTDKNEACKNFKQADKDGLRQLKPYRLKYCK